MAGCAGERGHMKCRRRSAKNCHGIRDRDAAIRTPTGMCVIGILVMEYAEKLTSGAANYPTQQDMAMEENVVTA